MRRPLSSLPDTGHGIPRRNQHKGTGLRAEVSTARGGGPPQAQGKLGGGKVAIIRLWGPPKPFPEIRPDNSDNTPLARARASTQIPAACGASKSSRLDGRRYWHQSPDGGDAVAPQESRDPRREDA